MMARSLRGKNLRRLNRERTRRAVDEHYAREGGSVYGSVRDDARGFERSGRYSDLSDGNEIFDAIEGASGGWINCECFFSLVLVGVLAALPFNMHTKDLLASQSGFVEMAKELYYEKNFAKAASFYERALNVEASADIYERAAECYTEARAYGTAARTITRL